MVEDSKIKTKVSPFAMREGEIKVFDGKDGYVSMNQILQKINQGQITDLHFKIIEYINEFEFLTSRQIYLLLKKDHIEIKNQDKLNKKLDQLIKNKIITRYYFTSAEGQGIYRVYCMEKMGKYLLNSREIECNWQPSDNAKPVFLMKKKLAANQLLIAYIRKVQAFKGFKIKPQLHTKHIHKPFKPSLIINFNYNDQPISFIFEVIRRNKDWEEQLINRMKSWKDFYDSFEPGDCSFKMIPQLVFLCEDMQHMGDILKVIVTNNINIDKIKLYYTTDLEQNNDNLSNSLYNFVIENGKYRINKNQAKILM